MLEVCRSQWIKGFGSRSNNKITAGVNVLLHVSSCKTKINTAMWHVQGKDQSHLYNWRYCKARTNSHDVLKSYGHWKATCWVADIHMYQIWWRGFESRSGQYIFCTFEKCVEMNRRFCLMRKQHKWLKSLCRIMDLGIWYPEKTNKFSCKKNERKRYCPERDSSPRHQIWHNMWISTTQQVAFRCP